MSRFFLRYGIALSLLLASPALAGSDDAVRALEQGRLTVALDRAAEARAEDPSDLRAQGVYAWLLVAVGRGKEAEPLLRSLVERPEADHVTRERAKLHLAGLALDRGQLSTAQTLIDDAAELPELSGVREDTQARLAELRGGGGGGPLGRVADSLRRGETDPQVEGTGPEAEIARALVARRQGDLPAAIERLQRARDAAKRNGQRREEAIAGIELAWAWHMSGSPDFALREVRVARDLLAGTSLEVIGATAALQDARLAALAKKTARAAGALDSASSMVTKMDSPRLRCLQLEAQGELALSEGDRSRAFDAFQASVSLAQDRGWHGDAARLSLRAVVASGKPGDARRASQAFERLGEPLGAAHVRLAEGLALVARDDTAKAVDVFLDAAALAEQHRGGEAQRVARVARENALAALQAQGLPIPAGGDLEAIAKWADSLRAAESSYEAGRSAFSERDWVAAEREFAHAHQLLVSVGETQLERTAKCALSWAQFNRAVGEKSDAVGPRLDAAVDGAAACPEDELKARALGLRGGQRAESGHSGAASDLREAGELADGLGLGSVAGQAWADLAELPGDLDERAASAMRAYEARPDKVGAYAMYSVAYDAWSADKVQLAFDLLEPMKGHDGQLSGAIQELASAVAEVLAAE